MKTLNNFKSKSMKISLTFVDLFLLPEMAGASRVSRTIVSYNTKNLNMKRSIIILFLLLGANVFAQVPVNSLQRNSLQLIFGVNQLKEENLHAKVHSGLITGISYQHCLGSKNISDFDISIKWSRAKTAYEDLSATANAHLSGSYRYLFKIFNLSEISYVLGPQINMQYNVSVYPNWDESHLYWANHIELGTDNILLYRLSESGILFFDLRFSIFSAFNQPEYNRMYKYDDSTFEGIVKNFHSDYEFGSVNKAFRLAIHMEYQFHLNPKCTQALCYSYDYLRIKGNENLPFQNNIHQVGFKIYFR